MIIISTYSNKVFYMRIPRFNILIADRPIYGKTVSFWRFKFIITPTLSRPAPDKGFPSYLIATYPVKRLLLYIRLFIVFDKKLLRSFIKSITAADNGIFLTGLLCQPATVLQFPRRKGSCWIILNMFYHTASF